MALFLYIPPSNTVRDPCWVLLCDAKRNSEVPRSHLQQIFPLPTLYKYIMSNSIIYLYNCKDTNVKQHYMLCNCKVYNVDQHYDLCKVKNNNVDWHSHFWHRACPKSTLRNGTSGTGCGISRGRFGWVRRGGLGCKGSLGRGGRLGRSCRADSVGWESWATNLDSFQ